MSRLSLSWPKRIATVMYASAFKVASERLAEMCLTVGG